MAGLSFSEFYSFSGNRLDWTIPRLNNILAKYEILLNNFYSEHIQCCGCHLDKSMKEDILEYMGFGYICNAYDSILLMCDDSEDTFVGKLELMLIADSSELTFKVNDNGIGISNSKKDLLFKKQINSTKSSFHLTGGAGIHLLRISKILDLVGGNYGFESSGVRKGAIFWYGVPVESLREHISLRYSDWPSMIID